MNCTGNFEVMNNAVDKYYRESRVEMKRFVPKTYTKVLEIGCSSGNFAKQLCKPGCEVWGVEPHHGAAEEAATKIDRVLTGTFLEHVNSIPDNYFDLVVCNDVMEHMVDHDRFVEEIKTKLTAGGMLIGSVPNILHVTSLFKIIIQRDWPYDNAGIYDRTHLRVFTSKSLKRCLMEHNFTLVDFSGINSIIKNGTHLRRIHPFVDGAVRAGTALFVAATFGYYYDSQYPQLAFAVRKSD